MVQLAMHGVRLAVQGGVALHEEALSAVRCQHTVNSVMESLTHGWGSPSIEAHSVFQGAATLNEGAGSCQGQTDRCHE